MKGWRGSQRRFLVPEVLQTSLMDCGPAALKAVLEGFGIPADYDALRERCQTDVDGTSIDALAALGRQYGLRASRVLVARDSFLLPESSCLPAIVLTRSAGGLLHFDVVWRRVGPFVQVMDPCAGRRWVRSDVVLARMPDVPIPVSMQRWRSWASTRNARAPLLARLARLGIGPRPRASGSTAPRKTRAGAGSLRSTRRCAWSRRCSTRARSGAAPTRRPCSAPSWPEPARRSPGASGGSSRRRPGATSPCAAR